GTGKTHTVVSRFVWLVDQGVPAERILALTFSAPAAAQMRERLEAVLDAPDEELHVETFRSFCLRLLQDEALEACVDPFLTPVTPAARLALLLERIDDLSLREHEIRGNPAPLLASFVARIDRLKDEMVSADDYRASAERMLGAGGAARGGRAARRASAGGGSWSSRASTRTTTACSPSAGRSTTATSSCAPSSCSTSA